MAPCLDFDLDFPFPFPLPLAYLKGLSDPSAAGLLSGLGVADAFGAGFEGRGIR